MKAEVISLAQIRMARQLERVERRLDELRQIASTNPRGAWCISAGSLSKEETRADQEARLRACAKSKQAETTTEEAGAACGVVPLPSRSTRKRPPGSNAAPVGTC